MEDQLIPQEPEPDIRFRFIQPVRTRPHSFTSVQVDHNVRSFTGTDSPAHFWAKDERNSRESRDLGAKLNPTALLDLPLGFDLARVDADFCASADEQETQRRVSRDNDADDYSSSNNGNQRLNLSQLTTKRPSTGSRSRFLLSIRYSHRRSPWSLFSWALVVFTVLSILIVNVQAGPVTINQDHLTSEIRSRDGNRGNVILDRFTSYPDQDNGHDHDHGSLGSWFSFSHVDSPSYPYVPVSPSYDLVSTAPFALSTTVVEKVQHWYSKWKADKVRRKHNAEVFYGRWYERTLSTEAGSQKIHKRSLTTTEKVEAALIPILVLLSGLFAGLTLGYFSIDPTQLHVLAISGTEKQKAYARKIMPVRKNGHLLLTTLLLANMIVNETLPEISNGPLGGGFQAVVVSTVLIVLFAEIIPQSVCSRYGLLVGAKAAPLVRVMIWVFFIVAYPVAKLLEWSLGAHHGIIYRRAELKELIKIHAQGGEGGGDLDLETVTMAQGALGLQDKIAKDVMTPIDSVFMLPISAKLDYETLGEVVKSGHSRIPVYSLVEVPDISAGVSGKTRIVKKILGCLLVKSCILLDPEDATPLSSIPINAIPSVPWDEPLTNMLNSFQEGRSHMAIISRRGRRLPEEDAESVMSSTAIGMRKRLFKKFTEKVKRVDTSSGSDNDDSISIEMIDLEKGENLDRVDGNGESGTNPSTSSDKESSKKKKSKRNQQEKKTSRRLADAAKLQPQEQILPSDAQLADDRVEKFFEGLEGAPLGIITLEDVLEALIGEEIADEYDFDEGTQLTQPLEASHYVPPEAAKAAKAAAAQRFVLASATPLPANADHGLIPNANTNANAPSPAPSVNAGKSTKMVKISIPSIPKLAATIGGRASSTPGRKRGSASSTPTSIAGLSTLPNGGFNGDPGFSGIPSRVSSPEQLEVVDAEAKYGTEVETGIKAKQKSRASSLDMNRIPPTTAHASGSGSAMASAIPNRMFSSTKESSTQSPTSGSGSGMTSTNRGSSAERRRRNQSTPPPTPPLTQTVVGLPNPLSEALVIERGRRRLGLASSSAPVVISAPGTPTANLAPSAGGSVVSEPDSMPIPVLEQIWSKSAAGGGGGGGGGDEGGSRRVGFAQSGHLGSSVENTTLNSSSTDITANANSNSATNAIESSNPGTSAPTHSNETPSIVSPQPRRTPRFKSVQAMPTNVSGTATNANANNTNSSFPSGGGSGSGSVA